MDKIKVIVIGAGGRGLTYTNIMKDMFGDNYEVVGVAEPIEDRREYTRKKHNIPEENCFESWEQILDVPKFADVAIISTMDRMHYEPSIKAMNMGYNLLLEKPVSPIPSECVAIEECAKKNGVKVVVCHVLRYTPFFKTIKRLIDEDAIGKVITIDHLEGVGNVHQSHSFVRGNWGNSIESSPMILQKCCHDTDILQWLVGSDCESVQSFGSLAYFNEANAPCGAPERCIDGCPVAEECPYNAVKLYYDDKDNYWFRSTSTFKTSPTDEDVMDVLKTTNFGKCVFRCNNDVVDNQVVNMLFKNGATATMSMNAFNLGGREIRVMGTKGEIFGRACDDFVELYDFATKEKKKVSCNSNITAEGIVGGHGGGDEGIVKALIEVMNSDDVDGNTSSIEASCKSHLIAFAAEKSRIENVIVKTEEIR